MGHEPTPQEDRPEAIGTRSVETERALELAKKASDPLGSSSDGGLASAAAEAMPGVEDLFDERGLVDEEAIDTLQAKASETGWESLGASLLDTVATIVRGSPVEAFGLNEEKRAHIARIWAPYLDRRFPLKPDAEWIKPALVSGAYLAGPVVQLVRELKHARDAQGEGGQDEPIQTRRERRAERKADRRQAGE